MAIMIMPLSAVLFFFSEDILFLWLRNLQVASNGSLIVSILVLGKSLNGLMQIPYMLQLAYGWTSLGFIVNLFSIVFLLPLMVCLAKNFGAAGGASVWLILNIAYIGIGIQIMHRKILPTEKWRWYGQDVLLPMIAAFTTTAVWLVLIGRPATAWVSLISIVTVGCLSFLLTSLSVPLGRSWFRNNLNWLGQYLNSFKVISR